MDDSKIEQLTDDERHRLHLVLRDSTPADRLDWLEDLRLLFGVDHIRTCQEIKWAREEAWKPLNSPPPFDR